MKKKVAFLLDGFGNRRHYVQIMALKEANFEPKIITFQQAKEGYLLSKGLEKEFSIIFPFPRPKIMKKFSLSFALTLLKCLKKEEIQIVLTHRYKLLRYLWFCKIFYPQLKIIFHMVIADAIKGHHQKFWFKRFKSCIDKILVNSIALKEELIKKKLANEEEVEILYSGIDLKEFAVNINKGDARRSFGIEEDVFLFGMIAQFRKEKDQRNLIKVLKILKEKGYRVKLVFAGDGPLLEMCKKLARDLNLERDIIFLGKVDASLVPILLKALDAFVYATFREGMPLAVLEAMASGLPIVATNAEGLPDIFNSHKKFGFLVPKGDVIKLAEAMERVINLKPEEREQMGRCAIERINEAFSQDILKSETIKIFEELSH